MNAVINKLSSSYLNIIINSNLVIAVTISSLQCPGIQMSVFIIQLTVVLVRCYKIVERDAPTVPSAVLKAILMATNSEIFKAVTTESMIFHTVSFSGKVILSHCTRLHLACWCENHVVDNPKDYIWWANKRHPKIKVRTTVMFHLTMTFSLNFTKDISEANSKKIDRIHSICATMVSINCIRTNIDFWISARMWPIYLMISKFFFLLYFLACFNPLVSILHQFTDGPTLFFRNARNTSACKYLLQY